MSMCQCWCTRSGCTNPCPSLGLLVPAIEQSCGGKHAVDARQAGRDDVLVDHHECQPAVALEWEALVKGDDLALLFVEQPVVTQDMAVVLVRLAVAVQAAARFSIGWSARTLPYPT